MPNRAHPALRAALALPALTFCASVEVTNREPYAGGKLPRPGRILIHDFAATPEDLPAFAAAGAQVEGGDEERKPEEVEVGRQLGQQVAQELVSLIVEMGLPAFRAASQADPRVDDLVIVGYFGTLDEGAAVERIVVGFGAGNADLTTRVEAYRMTTGGLEKLGSGDVDSSGGKTPGVVVPALVTVATANPIGLVVGGAVKAAGELSGRSTLEGSAKRTAQEIADVLEKRFEEQGWIQP